MKRFFYLTLTLIVLVAVASTGWKTLGALAGEEDMVLSASPDAVSGDRVFYEDAREVESSDIFIAEAAPEQAEDPFAAELPAEHDAEFSSPKSPERQQVLQEQAEQMLRQAAELMKKGLPAISEQIRANAEKLATGTGYAKIDNELIREANSIANLDVVKLHGIETLLNLEKEAKELAAQGKTEELDNLQYVYNALKAIVEGQSDYRRHSDRLHAMEMYGVDLTMRESLDNSFESDQFIRNELEELVRKLNVEAQGISTLIERDPKILELRNEAENLDGMISKHEETPKDPQSSLVLKSLQHAREKLEKTINYRRQELRPLIKERMHTKFAAAEHQSKYRNFLEQRARQQKDQPKSFRLSELLETEENRHANAGPEEREIQRRIEHLQRAIENLKQAGLEKQAQELHHQMDRMRVELQERHERRAMQERERRHRQERVRRDHAPRDNVDEALNDLRHEIRELRNEVREMHEMLEQHVKHRGDDRDKDDEGIETEEVTEEVEARAITEPQLDGSEN